jgi:hypothetical protein
MTKDESVALLIKATIEAMTKFLAVWAEGVAPETVKSIAIDELTAGTASFHSTSIGAEFYNASIGTDEKEPTDAS